MKKKIYILLIFILCVIDQVSKFFINKYMAADESIIIIKDFLKLFYVKNIGISFGMFKGFRLPIIIVSVLIIGYMIYDFVKSNSKFHMFSVALIISGATGNLIDRLFRGYVIDFISFTLFKKEMSIFNIADACITIGVILYMIYVLIGGKNEEDSSE